MSKILAGYLILIILLSLTPSVQAQQAASLPKLSDSLDTIMPNDFDTSLETPAGIINAILKYVFVLTGLILFGMLIMGGFQMLASGGNPKAAEAGKARLTSAILGFLIVFAAYWITQIVSIIFGIDIL